MSWIKSAVACLSGAVMLGVPAYAQLGRSDADVMAGLDVQQVRVGQLRTGEPRRTGLIIGRHMIATLEMIGPSDDLRQVAMMLTLMAGSPESRSEGHALVMLFAGNLDPTGRLGARLVDELMRMYGARTRQRAATAGDFAIRVQRFAVDKASEWYIVGVERLDRARGNFVELQPIPEPTHKD